MYLFYTMSNHINNPNFTTPNRKLYLIIYYIFLFLEVKLNFKKNNFLEILNVLDAFFIKFNEVNYYL